MAIDVLGLGERLALAPADPLDENDTLRRQNPLGKMPCLAARRRHVDLRQRRDRRIFAGALRQRPADPAARPAALQGADAGAARRRHHGCLDPGRLRRPLPRPASRRPSAGSRISAARSSAGWPPLRLRRPIRAKPISCRIGLVLRARLSRLAQAGRLAPGLPRPRRVAQAIRRARAGFRAHARARFMRDSFMAQHNRRNARRSAVPGWPRRASRN